MTTLSLDERRLVLRLLARWHDLRGDRDLPSRSDLVPEAFGEDWRYCALVSIHGDEDWRIEEVGDMVGVGCEAVALPCSPDALPEATVLAHATAYVARVLARRVPISIGGTFPAGDVTWLYRSIVLPLSNDGARIDHLLCGANYRTVPAVAAVGDSVE